jgi:hypothetical protein
MLYQEKSGNPVLKDLGLHLPTYTRAEHGYFFVKIENSTSPKIGNFTTQHKCLLPVTKVRSLVRYASST